MTFWFLFTVISAVLSTLCIILNFFHFHFSFQKYLHFSDIFTFSSFSLNNHVLLHSVTCESVGATCEHYPYSTVYCLLYILLITLVTFITLVLLFCFSVLTSVSFPIELHVLVDGWNVPMKSMFRRFFSHRLLVSPLHFLYFSL